MSDLGVTTVGPATFRAVRVDHTNLAILHRSKLRAIHLSAAVVASSGLYAAAFNSRVVAGTCFVAVILAELVAVPWLSRRRRVPVQSLKRATGPSALWEADGRLAHLPIIRGDAHSITAIARAISNDGAGCLPFVSRVPYPLNRVPLFLAALLLPHLRGPAPPLFLLVVQPLLLLPFLIALDRSERVETLKHVWYRVSAGRLEILHAQPWSLKTAVVQTIQLCGAGIEIDFDAALVRITEAEPGTTRASIEMERLDDPYGFAGAVLVAASAIAPAPELPPGRLLER